MRHVISLICALALAAPAWAGEAETASVQQDADRFTLLEGGRNFRDVGGYRTADGRVVKHRIMYRSGSLGSLSLSGQQQLAGLHVTSIIDLRTTDERSQDMNNWLAASGQGYWTRDYDMSLGNMSAIFANPANRTAEAMTAMMANAYRTMPQEQAPSYRLLFDRLVHGKGALVVNCTAGKDRTGIVSALVLTVLGVPYETVRQDFLLSNGAPGMDTLMGDRSSSPLARLPKEVLAPLVGVDGVYLDTAFEQLRQDYGSIENFLQKELGVGPREIAALRRRMLS